jgi:ABC-2 type transport system permease protein
MFLALAKKELLALSRDLHGLAALFLLPMVFIIIMSMALKDVYSPRVQVMRYAVVNQDPNHQAERLLTAWREEHGAPEAVGVDGWQDAVRSGRLKYVLQVDAGFSSSLDSDPDEVHAEKVHFFAEPGLDKGLYEITHASLVMHVAQLRTEIMLTQMGVEGDTAKATKALFSSSLVEGRRMGTHIRPSSVQQSVPGWLVFGMFFVVASIAGLFVDERGCGALARLRSLGVTPGILLGAKVLPYMLVNGVQAVLMLSVGVWLMPLLGGEGLSLQGVDWGALVLVLLAISAAAVGMALAIACLVRTHAQASTLGPILNVLMAALGGIMVPLFVMPEVMQHIAAYSPMHWGLEGLLDVLLRGADISAVLSRVGRLCVFAALMLGSAYLLVTKKPGF